MNTIAAPVVSLVRKFPAPRLPNIVAPPPPPNTAPISRALAALEQHDHDQEQAHEHVEHGEERSSRGPLPLLEADDAGECSRARGSRRRPARRRCRAAPSASSTLSGFTEPPYWIRIASPAAPKRARRRCAHERVHLLGDLGRGGAAGADRPDRLVGDHELRGARSGHHARGCPRAARPPRRSVRPASRSSSDSPTQTIGRMPCASSAAALFATSASLSP